ncbi:MAG TPA: hypothetical protein VLC52_01730 [Anaerolineae bacterium]|nr:hypothetical protein [Anaerolineae bacterium]
MSDLVNYEDEELLRERYYKEHYDEVYAAGGYPYEHYKAAYQYGHLLGMASQEQEEKEWMLAGPAARWGWEDLSEEPWADVEEAVHEGWRRALRGE